MEKRVRRYKQKLKSHHNGTPQKEETANVTVLRSNGHDLNGADMDEDDFDDGMDHSSPPQAMIIAETRNDAAHHDGVVGGGGNGDVQLPRHHVPQRRTRRTVGSSIAGRTVT